jgi:hypothetical protein
MPKIGSSRPLVINAMIDRSNHLNESLVELRAHESDTLIAEASAYPLQEIFLPKVQRGFQSASEPAHSADVKEKFGIVHGFPPFRQPCPINVSLKFPSYL